MRNPVPDFIDVASLEDVQADERIIDIDELILHIGPIYNAAELTEDSTQDERRKAWDIALEKVIRESRTLTPRSHSELGWCLATTFDPIVSCRPVIAGSDGDLTIDERWARLNDGRNTGSPSNPFL